MGSLRQKLINGTIWNSISQFGTVLCNFALTFVLGRLLEPKDYGLLGMVMVITGFLGYFSEFGIIDSLIRKQNHDELDEHTAFWTGIGFSIIVYIFIYLISPLISLFYSKPELTSISRASALGFIISSYGFVPVALDIKKLHYPVITLISLTGLFISGSIAIFFAYCGWGVWTLVMQLLLNNLVCCLGYYFFIRWKPKFLFSIDRFKSTIGFGAHRTFNNIFTFLSDNIDQLLIGKLLGSVALGYYTMAFRLTRFPVQKFWAVFGKMLFPAFAQMQNDLVRLKRNYYKVTLLGGFMLLPFVAALFYATEPLVRLAVGEKWLPICNLIRILCLYLLVYSFSLADEPITMLLRIKFLNIMKMVQAFLFTVSGIYVLKKYDIVGIAWLYIICYFVYIIALKIRIHKILFIDKGL